MMNADHLPDDTPNRRGLIEAALAAAGIANPFPALPRLAPKAEKRGAEDSAPESARYITPAARFHHRAVFHFWESGP